MTADWLLIVCAAGCLVCFGAIFCIALAEYRRSDPFAEPYGDVPAGTDNLKSTVFHEGRE